MVNESVVEQNNLFRFGSSYLKKKKNRLLAILLFYVNINNYLIIQLASHSFIQRISKRI